MQIHLSLSVLTFCTLFSGCSSVDIPDPKPEPVSVANMGRVAQPIRPAVVSNAYGSYSGSIQTQWLGNGQMRLLSDFSYTDPEGVKWLAPKDSIVNGASIPSQLWGILGGPFAGKYRDASVIHDVACVQRNRPWWIVHKAFYNAMRASGVSSSLAKLMYASVYHFGPRWENESGISRAIQLKSLSKPLSANKMDQLKRLLENNQNMSLEDIQKLDVSNL